MIREAELDMPVIQSELSLKQPYLLAEGRDAK